MTSYASEEDFLKDQIQSNNLAIEFIKDELEKVISELPEDHVGTKEKIINVYTRGIGCLKKDKEVNKRKINAMQS